MLYTVDYFSEYFLFYWYELNSATLSIILGWTRHDHNDTYVNKKAAANKDIAFIRG